MLLMLVIHWLARLPQQSVTSRLTPPTETRGRPSSKSSRASSRPPSPAGSWAGTMTTGPVTPWSEPWQNWLSELAPPLSLLDLSAVLLALCYKYQDFVLAAKTVKKSYLKSIFFITCSFSAFTF